MKKALCYLLPLLLSVTSYCTSAQTISASRLLVRDSIYLHGKWYQSFGLDTTAFYPIMADSPLFIKGYAKAFGDTLRVGFDKKYILKSAGKQGTLPFYAANDSVAATSLQYTIYPDGESMLSLGDTAHFNTLQINTQHDYPSQLGGSMVFGSPIGGVGMSLYNTAGNNNTRYDITNLSNVLAFYSYPAGGYGGLAIAQNGNVGIGTWSPDARLMVNGSAHINGQMWTNNKLSVNTSYSDSTLMVSGGGHFTGSLRVDQSVISTGDSSVFKRLLASNFYLYGTLTGANNSGFSVSINTGPYTTVILPTLSSECKSCVMSAGFGRLLIVVNFSNTTLTVQTQGTDKIYNTNSNSITIPAYSGTGSPKFAYFYANDSGWIAWGNF
jgi:hypothetical protein